MARSGSGIRDSGSPSPESRAPNPEPRIHSSRSRSTPAAAAEATSRRSCVSTKAAISPRRVAIAMRRSRSVIRPDEHGPVNSDNWPLGSPPRKQASRSGTFIGSRHEGSVHSHDGSVVVSVRSSLRARRADSRTATAGCAMTFAIYSPALYDRIARAIKRRKFAAIGQLRLFKGEGRNTASTSDGHSCTSNRSIEVDTCQLISNGVVT